MSERLQKIEEEIATKYGREVRNVTLKGVVYAGQSGLSEEMARTQVATLESLIPLFEPDNLFPAYQTLMHQNEGEVSREQKIHLLQSVAIARLTKHFGGNDTQNYDELSKLLAYKENVGAIFDLLRQKGLHKKTFNQDPFSQIVEDGEITISIGETSETLEVRGACPAAGVVRELYWKFNDVISRPLVT